ncbi:hypothetical protein Bbelb_197100 [Branchiostoma belcheri]|nr:hypothetical protein Bbelb_197100 [Branchiostoma belcheri]
MGRQHPRMDRKKSLGNPNPSSQPRGMAADGQTLHHAVPPRPWPGLRDQGTRYKNTGSILVMGPDSLSIYRSVVDLGLVYKYISYRHTCMLVICLPGPRVVDYFGMGSPAAVTRGSTLAITLIDTLSADETRGYS